MSKVYSGKAALRNRKGMDIAQGPAFKANRRTGSIMRSASTQLVDDRTGEYNASSKKDLIEIMDGMVKMARAGEIHSDEGINPNQTDWNAQGHLVQAALSEARPAEGGPFQVLGEVFTDSIAETMGRMGFSNKVLAQQDVAEGGTARIRIRQKDVTSWLMLSDGHTIESLIRQKYIYPRGYNLETLILMEEAEIHEAGAQIIEEKYNDGLEATMVRDDNITKFLLDQAAPTDNDVIAFNAFTPQVFVTLRNQIWQWSLPAPHALMAVDLWDDLFADQDWAQWYSPIEKHELAVEGKLGRLADIELITDGFRYDTLQVLAPGEVYFLSSPATLGVKANMIALNSSVVDQRMLGRAVRGWFIFLRQATVIANSRGVSKGIRLQ
jgi:hypothetical protein